MGTRPKKDPFEYVNRVYHLKLRKNSPVLGAGGRRGQVITAQGQYIYIQWDGEPNPRGPYHPTSMLTHLDPEGEVR